MNADMKRFLLTIMLLFPAISAGDTMLEIISPRVRAAVPVQSIAPKRYGILD